MTDTTGTAELVKRARTAAQRMREFGYEGFEVLDELADALEAAERERDELKVHGLQALRLAHEMQDKAVAAERERALDAVMQAFEKGRGDVIARMDNPDDALVEAVAMAIFTVEYNDMPGGWRWEQEPGDAKDYWRASARGAIDALARTLEGKENSP